MRGVLWSRLLTDIGDFSGDFTSHPRLSQSEGFLKCTVIMLDTLKTRHIQ